jgi:hypothetical protein
LNTYYNRWAATAPASPTTAPDNLQPTTQPAAEPAATSAAPDQPVTGLIADFDTLTPSLEAYNDDGGVTAMTCAGSNDQKHGGANSLRLDFNIVANGWATCAHFYDGQQNWSSGQGLSFYLRSASAGPIIHVDLYSGPDGQRETYNYTIELPADSVNAWIPIEVRWEDFHRSIWEENADAPFTKPEQITGFAFGFPTYQDTPNTGMIWIDDMRLLGASSIVEPTALPAIEPITEPAMEPTAEPTQGKSGSGLPCAASAILPIGFVILAWVLRRK